MRSICFFNNKGGVGKTTLICNLASYLAQNFGLKVLLVDADPQCNATQYILPHNLLEDSYENLEYATLLDVVKPLQIGDADINTVTNPVPAKQNRFGIDLIPGHPRMSLIEDILSRAWLEVRGGELGGVRKTNWCYKLNESLSQYDVVVYDVGPSLGALNRTILIGCDYFVTPMGCDTFSIMGINNISDWLGDWHETYDSGIVLAKKNQGSLLDELLKIRSVIDTLKSKTIFAGYTVQQYITKTSQGERRPTKAFELILQKIPKEINRSFRGFMTDSILDENLKLGDVPHLYSLVPLAQSANAPIHKLNGSDGVVGAQYSQIDEYRKMLEVITANLLNNIGLEEWL